MKITFTSPWGVENWFVWCFLAWSVVFLVMRCPMSKLVHFQGIEYEVPDWTRYIAQDGHATITVHEEKPLFSRSQWQSMKGKWDILSACAAPMVCVEVQ